MRHYFKPAIVATLLLLVVFAPQGGAFCQSGGHFEWVKGYGTTDPNHGACHITGSVADSLGNLYILGAFRNDSEWGTGWDAERLLPMAPYGPNPNNSNVIIAKISPEGEMVWKKVIHSNNGADANSLDIKKVGDTAFACLAEMMVSSEDNYTYYLDTLITERSDYPVSTPYLRNPLRTVFIMFDFDGNVIEQHFLYVTYTDTAGNDFVKYYPDYSLPWYSNDRYRNPSFDIDTHGNIYISRASMDWREDSVNAQNGTIRGIKFWVDNRMVGECINESKPMRWYPQIMKFSPHFDTMLACRYLVQKNNNIEYSLYSTRTKVDIYGNIYFITEMMQSGDELADTVVIDSTLNIIWTHTDKAIIKNFIIKLDSNLTPKWIITLDDSVTTGIDGSTLYLGDIDFDYDSNLFFVYGSTGRGHMGDTVNFYSILTYRGIPLNLKHDSFFMSFKINSTPPLLHSYGRVPSVAYSDNFTNADACYSKNNIVCKKNRIFLQTRYLGGIHFPNGFVDYNNLYIIGQGFVIFDYQGKVIGGCDFATHSNQNYIGPISLHDSTLYLIGRLVVDATFGDIHFSTIGYQYAYIAKYVDTSFMTPYIPPTGDTGDVNIVLTPDVGVFTAYPNPFRQRVNIKIENTELKAVNGRVTAMLTDITGRSEEVSLTIEGSGNYVLDLTARPQASYFLTLTTADGNQHTVQLLKQSERFGDQ